MIWATVSSLSCFCWLYRASPSLAAKNIIWFQCWPSGDGHVRKGCLLWTVHSLGKALLAFMLLHFLLQGQTCPLFQVSLDFILLHSSSLQWKGHLFWVLVLEGFVGIHRAIQLQLLQHYWLGHRLGLLWYWMVCLGNEQRSFSHFWDCIQVLHFRVFCWPWGLLHFF